MRRHGLRVLQRAAIGEIDGETDRIDANSFSS
jgi:hypothetical protein